MVPNANPKHEEEHHDPLSWTMVLKILVLMGIVLCSAELSQSHAISYYMRAACEAQKTPTVILTKNRTTSTNVSKQQLSQPTNATEQRPRNPFLPNPNSSDVGGIYYCGYLESAYPFGKTVFPDYVWRYQAGYDRQSHQRLGYRYKWRDPGPNDILVHGLHGPCEIPWEVFPGKVLIANGEAHNQGRDINVSRITALRGKSIGEDIYQVGAVPDDGSHTVLSYYFVWGFLLRFLAKEDYDQKTLKSLTDLRKKPINNGRHHAVVYANTNCVRHREEAISQISNILPIHVAGACEGSRRNRGVVLRAPKYSTSETSGPEWSHNAALQRNYKFCFAMENLYPYHEYYITEKILNPFLAGCIPIYYGSPEVFDIFNPKAFIYYDPGNPEPALKQILKLSQNDTAYYEMLHNEPILAQGNETVRKHFSLIDSVGGGYLKHKIRNVMGV